MSVKVGKAGANKSAKRNYARLKQGSAVWRILPPLGKLADKGVWSVWHEVIFGYKTAEGFMRPFESCEVRNRKNRQMIETRCPARDEIAKKEADLVKLEEALEKQPKNIAIQKAINEVKEYLDQYNLDKAHYVNAMSLAGEVTLLRVGYKEMLALKAAREKLQKEDGIDPLDVNGAFLQFDKTGTGRDTMVQVSGFYEKQGNAKVLKTHDLDDNELDKVAQGYFELDDIYPRPTQEEIQRMVDTKDGEVVEEIMESYRTQYAREEAPAAAKSNAPAQKAANQRSEAVNEDNAEELPANLTMDEPTEEGGGDTIMDVIGRTGNGLQKALQDDRKVLEQKAAKGTSVNGSAKGKPEVKGPSVNNSEAAPTKAELSEEELAFMKEYGIQQ
jgi:hypothetical protein